MSWRDRYQQGSFRGVRFLSVRHDLDFGRRGPAHQYPDRDTPYFEDLGRKGKGWSLSVFVIGPDYMDDRDALIAAFDQAGAGTLVHPWLGTFDAQVTDARLSESTDEGGMARFDVQFVEPGIAVTASVAADTSSAAIAAADQVDADAAKRFSEEFQTSGKPPFVDDAASKVTGELADQAMLTGTTLGGSGAARTAFADALAQLHDPGIIYGASTDLAATMISLMHAIGSLGTRPSYQVLALRQVLSAPMALPTIRATTPSRALQARNQQALADLFVATAAAAAVRSAVNADFDSYDDAVALRDSLGDDLDVQALAAAARFNDRLANDLDTLRRAMVADVTARGGSLARLFRYTPPAVTPALVLAWRLYGDATATIEQAGAIVTRNRVRHPGFVPAAEISVLTAKGIGYV